MPWQKTRFAVLQKFVWKRMIVMLQIRHRWHWTDIRRRYITRTGRWLPITAANGTVLFDLNSVTVGRYRWRGNKIPNRWTALQSA
ncbi:hypothetical protein [Nocardia sp. SC052]|uniref:hypothetical protein n=1 Tax=Nocardia sichangensis TaxID=3385975 RepID=UPI0039A07D79